MKKLVLFREFQRVYVSELERAEQVKRQEESKKIIGEYVGRSF